MQMFSGTPQPKQPQTKQPKVVELEAAKAHDASFKDAEPQQQFFPVPVPVPMGAQAAKNGLYEDTSFAAPVMIPVPVPVPVPMGGGPGRAPPASFAAGQDLYNAMAFQENYMAMFAGGYPTVPPPTQQHYDAAAVHGSSPGFVPPPGFKLVRDEPVADQPPAGFVPPPGFKFVRAPLT